MRAKSGRGVLGQIDRLLRTGTAAGVPDGRLLEQFLGRHDEAAEAAFAALVERHGPMVMGVCWRTLHDHHDAQDAFQATFLVLARKAGTVRNRNSLVDWLYGVARRVSSHARVASARRREVERRTAHGASTVFEARPIELDLWDEVDRLPIVLRHAVVLCYLEGLTHEQAALRLGWPVGTLRSRLARARDRLRVRLTRHGLAPDAALMPFLSLKPPALSWDLIRSMAQAAIRIAARDAAEAGLVSTSAASLTEGVLRTMLFVKLKTAAAAIFVTGALASGVAVWGYQDLAHPGASGRQAAPSGTVPQAPQDPIPAAQGASSRDLSELYIAELEQLLKRAQARQANGSVAGVHQVVLRIENVVGQWKDALKTELAGAASLSLISQDPSKPAHQARGQNSSLADSDDIIVGTLRKDAEPTTDRTTPRQAAPDGGVRRPKRAPTTESPMTEGESQRRLEELERKVDRILQAVEKQAIRDSNMRNPTSTDDPPSKPASQGDVQGTVRRIDPTGRRAEISIGSDDGLVPGHELSIFRETPSANQTGRPR